MPGGWRKAGVLGKNGQVHRENLVGPENGKFLGRVVVHKGAAGYENPINGEGDPNSCPAGDIAGARNS